MTVPRSALAPPPAAHGGDGWRLAGQLGIDPDRVLDLSVSLNPVAPDVAAIVRKHAEAVSRYPAPLDACQALATAMQLDPDRLLLTNGGAEAIALVAAEHPVGWVDEPEFSLYRRHLAVLDPAGPRWRSNPHNPSGLLAAPEERAEVWDEAFWPLASGTWTRNDPGVTVVGSLTKLLACPGLRVGYVLCPDPTTAASLRDRQPLWSVNGLAAAALPELLDHLDLAATAAEVAGLRQRLVTVLRRAGLEPQPSDANWVLVEEPDLREQLAAHAIAVRDCTSFGLPGTVRIAVPGESDLDRLARAL